MNLSSPRRRRRLAWGSGALLAVGGLVAIGLLWPNTAPSNDEPIDKTRPPQVYREPQTVKLTRASRAQALTTAANFVKTAVVRRNVGRSWDLVSPALKQNVTRSEWNSGNIPVVPYPVAQARWKLDYSYEDGLGLQVLLFPEARSGLRPNLFFMELKRVGDSGHRRWVVDSWAPSGVTSPAFQAPGNAPGRGGGSLGVQPVNSAVVGGDSRLGATWLLVPIGLLGIVPVVLILLAVRSWLRGRRAERAYREHALTRGRYT